MPHYTFVPLICRWSFLSSFLLVFVLPTPAANLLYVNHPKRVIYPFFFEDYKKLENKTVEVEEFQNREMAYEIIRQSMIDYQVLIQN